jgi:hypothetical protein
MNQNSAILRFTSDGKAVFYCPGCKARHAVPVNGSPNSWGFNGSATVPTFRPSVMVQGVAPVCGEAEMDRLLDTGVAIKDIPHEATVCHSFVTNGRIQFLADCTHSLAGQTFDLPEFPRG